MKFAATVFADTLVLRDGLQRQGKVRSCDEEACSIDGVRVDLSAIARIEFRSANVPSVVPPKSILRTDNTIVLGFSGLSLGYVYAGDREIEREDVAVIFIVPPPAPTPAPDPSPVVQPSRPADPAPAPAPSQPSSSPPVAPPSVAPPRSPLPSPRPSAPTGSTWSGRMRGLAWGTVDGCRSRINIDVVVHFSETIGPLSGDDGTLIGTATLLDPTGSIVRNRYTSVCSGGSATGRGTITIGDGNARGGVIYRNTKGTPRRIAYSALELRPGQEWYTFTVAANDNPEYETTVRNVGGSFSSSAGFIFPVVGGVPMVPSSQMSDPEARYVQGGRMAGAFVIAATGAFEKLALSWSVCRRGVRCSMPPLPDEGQQQRCPQEAQAELCGDQLVGLVEELEPMQEEYARLMKLADSYYADYVSALRRCVAWRVIQTILETILGAQTAKLGQAGENAANALRFFEALIEGDPTGPLGDALMSDAEGAFYPLELANKIKGYLEEGNQIGEVLSRSGDLNSLRGVAVDACLGSVSPELHMRAQKFVDYTRQAAEYYKNVFAPKMNDVDAKMRECADRDTAAAHACQ